MRARTGTWILKPAGNPLDVFEPGGHYCQYPGWRSVGRPMPAVQNRLRWNSIWGIAMFYVRWFYIMHVWSNWSLQGGNVSGSGRVGWRFRSHRVIMWGNERCGYGAVTGERVSAYTTKTCGEVYLIDVLSPPHEDTWKRLLFPDWINDLILIVQRKWLLKLPESNFLDSVFKS